MWQGGNQWSAWDSFLSFFRDVVKLPLEYTHYNAWEYLAKHSGPRIVHEKFCIISDRPEILQVDEQNRPHCQNGPFCRWRDGSALYAIHGVRIPAWIVLFPERITVRAIDDETNAEIRRVLLSQFGLKRYIQESAVIIVDSCDENFPLLGLQGARLLRKEQPNDEPLLFVEVRNSTKEQDGSQKTYLLPVDPNAYDGTTQHSCLAAVASTWRRTDGSLFFKTPKEYAPYLET